MTKNLHPTYVFLVAALDKAGKTREQLGRELGSEGGQIVNNWKTRGVPASRIKQLASLLGVDREAFEEGDLSKLDARSAMESKPLYRGDYVSVPRLSAAASMGHGFPDDLGHDTVVDTVSLSKEWIRSNLTSITSPANLKMLTGYGDSMQGTFSHGDVLFVDTGVSEVKVDAVYVLRLNDELYIKRLQRLPNGDIKMISDNRSYDPYVIENEEKNRFDVLGRVAGVWNFKRL